MWQANDAVRPKSVEGRKDLQSLSKRSKTPITRVPTQPVSGLTSFLSPSLLTKLADGYAAVGNTEPDPSPLLRLNPTQPFTAQSHR